MGQESHGIEGGQAGGDGDPEQAVRRLEDQAETIRGNLDDLVHEAERRGSRLVKPVAVGAGVAALVVLAVGGIAVWRGFRRRPTSRLRGLAGALRRLAEHPELVAKAEPSLSKKVLASAGAALASIAVHQLARVAASKLERTNTPPWDDDTAGA
jgi:hypothetical protein